MVELLQGEKLQGTMQVEVMNPGVSLSVILVEICQLSQFYYESYNFCCFLTHEKGHFC